MNIQIDIKKLIIFIIAFVIFTAIGAVSHEYGHILLAKSFGYDTFLHYGSMNYSFGELKDKLDDIHTDYKTDIENGTDFEKKAEYQRGLKKLASNGFWIAIGGPLQTILTGTIGLLFLIYRKKKIKLYGLKFIDWLAVFLTLFWLREVFNLVISIIDEMIAPIGSWFGGDEKDISIYLNLWEGTFSVVLGLIGLFITLFVIYKVIPNRLRFSFIIGGVFGGSIGFYLWMFVIGPIILP